MAIKEESDEQPLATNCPIELEPSAEFDNHNNIANKVHPTDPSPSGTVSLSSAVKKEQDGGEIETKETDQWDSNGTRGLVTAQPTLGETASEWRRRQSSLVAAAGEAREDSLHQPEMERDGRTIAESDKESRTERGSRRERATTTGSGRLGKSLRKQGFTLQSRSKSIRKLLRRVDLSSGNSTGTKSLPGEAIINVEDESGTSDHAEKGHSRLDQELNVAPTGGPEEDNHVEWCPEIPFENVSISIRAD